MPYPFTVEDVEYDGKTYSFKFEHLDQAPTMLSGDDPEQIAGMANMLHESQMNSSKTLGKF